MYDILKDKYFCYFGPGYSGLCCLHSLDWILSMILHQLVFKDFGED